MTDNVSKKFHVWNILIFICAICCLVCYDYYGGLWLKGVTSAWFVLLGLVNLLYARKMRLENYKFLIWILTGLFWGMCADVLLGVQFILGILSFALGHVCYLVAFCVLGRPRGKDLWLILPIAVFSLFIVAGLPFIRIDDPVLKKLLLGYAVIIACMLGKASANLNKSISRRLLFLGSLMFWVSDVMLAIDMFGTGSRITWILCSYNYWPAQNILAYAMFHYISENCRKE